MTKGRKDLKVIKDHNDLRVIKDHKDLKVIKDRKDLKVIKDRKVIQDGLVMMVLKDLQDTFKMEVQLVIHLIGTEIIG